jgi:hypothetical protein
MAASMQMARLGSGAACAVLPTLMAILLRAWLGSTHATMTTTGLLMVLGGAAALYLVRGIARDAPAAWMRWSAVLIVLIALYDLAGGIIIVILSNTSIS